MATVRIGFPSATTSVISALQPLIDVVLAPLVNLDDAHAPRGLRELCLQLFQRIDVATADGRDTERRADSRHLCCGQWELPFITGRHCSRPSPSTCCSVLMSMSPSRIFTFASVSRERRYTSSLSCTRPGASASSWRSASPKLAPKVRHSQRGMIASMGRFRTKVTLAPQAVNSPKLA